MITNPTVIVGMQRSGTSALAGALRKLGVYFGEEELLYAADGNNVEGYIEHRKATLLNLRCLDAFQMHPTSFNRLPDNWQEYPQALALLHDLTAFIVDDFSGRERWGIKQPVTSLVLPIYNEVFARLGLDPHYVLCVRNPIENMASEAKLDFGDSYRVMPTLGKRAIGSWLRYTLGSFADTVGHALSVVPYDRLLSEPREILRRIVDWSPPSESWHEAIGSVRTDLRHYRTSVDDLRAFPAIVRNTYLAALQFDGADPAKWEAMLALHREFLTWQTLFSEPEIAAGVLGLAWPEGGDRRVAEVRYQPNGHWQTVRLAIDAPHRTLVSGLLYGQPCRAWIRRSIWRSGDQAAQAAIRAGLGSAISSTRGIACLHGVFEPNQINLVTPDFPGPFELELEFLLEAGVSLSEAAAADLAQKLDRCARHGR